MHLSSITIKGFKSFPERTRLAFSPGVSVIVGPNGCGKSNITDAVLWALGEQSPLAVRGQTMQDMIFAGGDGESPRRYAEVEVVLDNGDGAGGEFSEICIRRRLDRNGEGEYRLNGARCRLVDVIETLADANLGREMHSVISQGRVDEIVHSKPRDRRLLIEEAAGLGKHRKRRRRAQLKLERTQDNLDRALDVEREARSRLRPLKRQAQAADIHARLEREAGELRSRLLADELRGHSSELDGAEHSANTARQGRQQVESELSEVNRRRAAIEERLAERDRERTTVWGRVTALRAAHERLSVRAEALSARRAELAAELERERAALGALADQAPTPGEESGADPVGSGLERIGSALGDASASLDRARAATATRDQAAAVAGVRDAAERAAVGAGRVEVMLGKHRQGSLEDRIAAATEVLASLEALLAAAIAARDAVGERTEELEGRMLADREADDVPAQLQACSRAEAELQARLLSSGDSVTEAEVRAAHLRDRRDEVRGELDRIASQLGRDADSVGDPLGEEERGEIERKLERVARRREALGPVNPLAEQEYAEALEHVEHLEEQRHDLESALAELKSLIGDTDRKIRSAFEETLEATQRNFEELIEHMFPGGRGRLRLVKDTGPRLVLGGEAEDGNAQGGEPSADPAGAESGADREAGSGVEIEVTPAGKATRRLSLLSGGEKALVALAFVFAVFLARPSPFYILDEVEAALDDANIDRFLQLVRRFSDRAQFVIVTHQKRTMDAADVLYGVSMGKGGITKVISRRLSHEDEADAQAA
jgi:chromosome segregation ATPase